MVYLTQNKNNIYYIKGSSFIILSSLVYRYRFTSAQVFLLFRSEYKICTCSCIILKKLVPFSMAIGNLELMQECFPKH